MAVTDEIKAWIMSWGAMAEVLEPESLREEIQSEIGEMLERYGKGVRREGKPVRA